MCAGGGGRGGEGLKVRVCVCEGGGEWLAKPVVL